MCREKSMGSCMSDQTVSSLGIKESTSRPCPSLLPNIMLCLSISLVLVWWWDPKSIVILIACSIWDISPDLLPATLSTALNLPWLLAKKTLPSRNFILVAIFSNSAGSQATAVCPFCRICMPPAISFSKSLTLVMSSIMDSTAKSLALVSPKDVLSLWGTTTSLSPLPIFISGWELRSTMGAGFLSSVLASGLGPARGLCRWLPPIQDS